MELQFSRVKVRKKKVSRRRFLTSGTGAITLGAQTSRLGLHLPVSSKRTQLIVDDFQRPDSTYHGDAWETLTPGHWRLQSRALRRDLRNAPDPPYGMIWNRHWELEGNYRIEADFTVRQAGSGDGHELLGICFGGSSLYEGWRGGGQPGDACLYCAWRGNGAFGLYDHSSDDPKPVREERILSPARSGDKVTLAVTVSEGSTAEIARVAVEVSGAIRAQVQLDGIERKRFTEGYLGLVCRGDLDFEVHEVRLDPGENSLQDVKLSDLVVAIPMGPTLRQKGKRWLCKILCLFRSEGRTAAIRIADSSVPSRGWTRVPLAGEAPIVTNHFRDHTSVVEASLPGNPAEKDYFFTVWKDGQEVTADPRVEPCVGRLPRLSSPYRVCGLSCHAISAKEFNEPNKNFPWRIDPARWLNRSDPERLGPQRDLFQSDWIFEQYAENSFENIEDFHFQILSWEDDIWYLEMPLFPPSPRDVYRRVALTVGGRR